MGMVCVWGGEGGSLLADQEGEASGPPTLENYKNIGFLSNTGSNPLKITMLGHHRPASETPLKWPANSGVWILLPLIKLKKKNKKKNGVSKLAPSDKTFWIHVCMLSTWLTSYTRMVVTTSSFIVY